jgi:hypothetical protein
MSRPDLASLGQLRHGSARSEAPSLAAGHLPGGLARHWAGDDCNMAPETARVGDLVP